MTAVSINFDTAALSRLDRRFRLLTDQKLRYIAARALNESGQAAKQALREAMPRYIDKPVPYTVNSAFQRFAKADNLSTTIGIADQSRAGRTPAAKYLTPMVKGTRPSIKGADYSASKIARVNQSAVLVPAKNSPLRKTAAGNYTISAYAKVLSSARQGGDKYFIAPVKPGSSTQAVFARAGRAGSTTRRVFTLDTTPAPRRAAFPVQQVLSDAFGKAWATEARKAFDAEMARTFGTGR